MTFDSRESSRYSGAPVECYRFVQGSNLWFFTSADKPITLATGTYSPETIERSAVEFSQEDESGELEVTLRRDNPVAQLFVSGLPATPVSLTLFRTHRSDGQVLASFVGTAIKPRFEGSTGKLTFAPLGNILKRRIPSLLIQSHCNWALYGVGCGVDRFAFRDAINVTSVNGRQVVSADFAARPNGWFTTGFIETAAGERGWIREHSGNTVTLMSAIAGLAGGQQVYAFAGCNHLESDCAGKFNNLVNHSGFPRTPWKNPYKETIT